MSDRAATLVEGRREKMERALGRTLVGPKPATGPKLSDSEREHLNDVAADLYLNELAWEDITDEEQIEGEPLAELAFPVFLAFIQGLLLEQVMPDSLAPANPRPEIVEEVLKYLAEQVVAFQDRTGAEGDTVRVERDLGLTDRLLDLVLFQFHGVDPADVEGFRDPARAS
jgi:hypothetical protein